MLYHIYVLFLDEINFIYKFSDPNNGEREARCQSRTESKQGLTSKQPETKESPQKFT